MSGSDAFALSIGWFGELDKPRREAILASASRAAGIEEDPFVAVAAISRGEFEAALEAIRSRGLLFHEGRPQPELDAYAAVADDDDHVTHASLGFDAATVRHLEAISSALEPVHRTALD